MESDPDASVTFAELLGTARTAVGLTQEELAERAQLSARAVSNLERGESSRPRRGTVDRLVVALGLTGREAEHFVALARGRRPDRAGRGPAQLPADLPDFTGRAAEEDRLTAVLDDPEHSDVRVVALGGGGGIGKTALAVHAAHRMRDRYPDGQLYLDLAGSRSDPVEPAAALAAFLTALGEEPGERGEGLARRAARYRSVLAGRRMLILLDDARDAAQVRPLLPAGAGSAVLVTSRSRLADLAGASHLTVEELTDSEAVTLLARIAGRARVAAEPGAAARVVAACGRLPLAVRIAGARLAVRPTWTVGALADRLSTARRRLDELYVGDLAVRASFRLSYRRLEPVPAELFALLGHWPGHDLAVPAAAALAGLDEDATERVLEELVDRHLLESPAPGRYRQHDLLHAFARELLADTVDADRAGEALRRLISFLTATAHQAGLALWPTDEPPFPDTEVADPRTLRFTGYGQALRWYDTEWPALVALLHRIEDDPRVPALATARLATLFSLYPFVRNDVIELERGARQSAVLAGRAGDDLLVAVAHKRLATALVEQRRLDEAAHHHELALVAFRAAGALDGEATILNSIGRRLMYEADRTDAPDGGDRYATARRYLLDSLAVARRARHRSAQAVALCNLGSLEHRAGRDGAAYRYLTEALSLSRQLGGGRREAAVLSNLGTVLAKLGRPVAAVRSHEQALAITRETGDRHSEASILVELSETYLTTGRAGDAVDCARQALRIRLRDGDNPAGDNPAAEGAARAALGRAMRALGLGREGRGGNRSARPVPTGPDRTATEVRAPRDRGS